MIPSGNRVGSRNTMACDQVYLGVVTFTSSSLWGELSLPWLMRYPGRDGQQSCPLWETIGQENWLLRVEAGVWVLRLPLKPFHFPVAQNDTCWGMVFWAPLKLWESLATQSERGLNPVPTSPFHPGWGPGGWEWCHPCQITPGIVVLKV